MAKQTINIGTAPNDGTGTPLRTAFDYCNLNFTELYTAVGPSGNNIVVPGSATITGDLTVDTNSLKVDTANNRVGILTSTPGFPLHVNGTDSNNVLFNGVSKGIRFSASASTSSISGVDNTGSLSYQPLTIEASTLNFALSGSTAMTLNSTGLGVGVTPSAKLDVSANDGTMAIFRSSGGSSNDKRLTISTGGAKVVFNISDNSNTAIARAYEFQTAGSAAMTLDASGNLLVGQTTQSLNVTGASLNNTGEIVGTVNGGSVLYVNRLTSDGTVVDLRRQSLNVGNISVTTTGATFNSISDYRLKESVAPLSSGLARVNALKPSIYKWKSNGSDGEGFLAHELAEVVPLAVTGEKDAVNEDGSIKPQGVDLSRVVPILVAAIKELTAEVNALKNA
jgi:hypothetical protein